LKNKPRPVDKHRTEYCSIINGLIMSASYRNLDSVVGLKKRLGHYKRQGEQMEVKQPNYFAFPRQSHTSNWCSDKRVLFSSLRHFLSEVQVICFIM